MEFDEEGELIENEYKWSDTYGLTSDGNHAIITQVNEEWRHGLYPLDKYLEVANANKTGIKKLGREIERIIKGADSHFSTHHKKGKLDTRRLWAVKTSERLFQKPKEHEAFNLRCVVLIDASGSMSGNRARMAGQAAVTLCEALEQVGADYEVVDFNSSNGGVDGYEDGATYINVRKAANKALDSRAKRQVVTPYTGSKTLTASLSSGRLTEPSKLARTEQSDWSSSSLTEHLRACSKWHGRRRPLDNRPLRIGARRRPIILRRHLAYTSRWYGNHGHASVSDVSTLAQDIIMPFKIAIKRLIKKGNKKVRA